MKLQFVGTGSAFTMQNYQNNIIIEEQGYRLLIDAGGDIRFALRDIGLSYKDINAVYITHGHADHIGGLEYLAFCSYFDPKKTKMQLYINKGLASDLWNNALSLGLGSIQGKIVNLRDYFNVMEIDDNEYFDWGSGKFELVQAVHIMNKYSIVKTYGLMITAQGKKKIYITGDTQFNPNQIKDFYKQADVIIQDCETTPFLSGVHANFEELKTLDKKTKRKMWLVHYQDNVLDDLNTWQDRAKKEGFLGFVERGRVLEQ